MVKGMAAMGSTAYTTAAASTSLLLVVCEIMNDEESVDHEILHMLCSGLSQAILSWLFLDTILDIQWFIGAAFIMIGVAAIQRGENLSKA